MQSRSHTRLVILVLVTAGLVAPAAAGKLYRWVDEEGNIQFSDRIPPSAVRKERAELDKRGLQVGHVEPAKTPEELARQAELERLRKEKERLIEEQEAADRVLLRSFRSVDDIALARDGKLAAVDILIQMARSNNKLLKSKLAEQQKAAAALERSGRAVPAKTRQTLATTQSALRAGYAQILQHQETKRRLREEYNADIARFRILKNLEGGSSDYAGVVETKPVSLPNVYACPDARRCDQAWKRAEEFVKRFATTPIRMTSEQVIMTGPPMADRDIAITVARLDGKESRLFLDVQCRENEAGQALCRDRQVQLLVERFQPYMRYAIDEQAEN
jgi:hypothetical protein